MLAEDAIKAALKDYKTKRDKAAATNWERQNIYYVTLSELQWCSLRKIYPNVQNLRKQRLKQLYGCNKIITHTEIRIRKFYQFILFINYHECIIFNNKPLAVLHSYTVLYNEIQRFALWIDK